MATFCIFVPGRGPSTAIPPTCQTHGCQAGAVLPVRVLGHAEGAVAPVQLQSHLWKEAHLSHPHAPAAQEGSQPQRPVGAGPGGSSLRPQVGYRTAPEPFQDAPDGFVCHFWVELGGGDCFPRQEGTLLPLPSALPPPCWCRKSSNDMT